MRCIIDCMEAHWLFSELRDIYSQLQVIKSELRDTNLQLWNSELEVGIADMQLYMFLPIVTLYHAILTL